MLYVSGFSLTSNFYELLCLCQLTFPDLHGLDRAARVIDRNASKPASVANLVAPLAQSVSLNPFKISKTVGRLSH